MQTSYDLDQSVAFEGMLGDLSVKDVESHVAEAEILIGKGVTQGTALGQVLHPDSAAKITDVKLFKGVAIHHHAMEQKYPAGSGNYSYPQYASVNVLRKGRVWVKPEQTVTAGTSIPHMRFANGIADVGLVQKGSFRKDKDGTAQVSTLTPTVANADVYSVSIKGADGKVVGSASYISDGTATAQEICDGLRAALGAVSGVVLSGTTTLIITSSEAGKPFTVSTSANLAVAATTANAVSAAEVPNAKYKSSTTSVGQVALLEIDL